MIQAVGTIFEQRVVLAMRFYLSASAYYIGVGYLINDRRTQPGEFIRNATMRLLRFLWGL